MKNKLTLALDWTPNINHIGFFVALEKGFYQQSGIDLQIIDPSEDNYERTPARKVALGLADFALCPTESILSYQTKTEPFPLIAIAAVLQEDLSAIVVKKDSGILSPKHLDGKIYGSYKARYEDEIVKQMIINDGGEGNIDLSYPNKFNIWKSVLDGDFDATWIFNNWEGIEAKAMPTAFSFFEMKNYNIPYSYSPVIAANATKLKSRKESYAQFLSATKKGFLFCQQEPATAVELFKKYIPKKDQGIDLTKALELSNPAFGNELNWGQMDPEVITKFLDWIYSKELESKILSATDIYTNELFEVK